MAELPLITCIMPTLRSRRTFAQKAIGLFLAQDYPRKQLVIVGEDNLDEDLRVLGANGQVVYLDAPAGIPVGTKRNLACARADGSLICHWDDDDWHAPRRLTRLYSLHRLEDADVVGQRKVVYYDPARDFAWVFQSPRIPWLVGGSLFYKRSLWKKNRFLDVFDGEDTAFIDGAVRLRSTIATEDNLSHYIAIIHDQNTTVRDTSKDGWERLADAKIIKRWMNTDRAKGEIDARA